MKKYIKLIRLYQWTKSGFIFLPFFFSHQLYTAVSDPLGQDSIEVYLHLILAFLGFSLTASSIYILNDYRDRELDRNDPRKKHRPLASGAVGVGFALGVMITFILLGGSIALFLGPAVFGLLLFYYVLNLFYNFVGKHILLIDVFIISIGYVLRVLVGAFAIEVEASPWILTTTFFIALFLGFFKRYYEALTGPEENYIGGTYNSETLKQFTTMTATLAILNYSIYCVTGPHRDAGLIWTIPFVVLGIFRYYVLLQHPEDLRDGNPSDLLLADKFLIVVIFFWLAMSAFLIVNQQFGWVSIQQIS